MRRARPRRVMLVTQSTAMGGMEMHVQYLAAELIARHATVSVVVPRDRAFDELARRCSGLNATVMRLDTDSRNGRRAQLFNWLRYAGWGLAQRPDVVHIHTGGATGGLTVAATSKWLFRATVVRTEHDVPEEAPGIQLKLSSRLTDACCDAVVAVSRRNAALRRVRLRTPKNFVAVLNGVPVPSCPTDPDRRSAVRRMLGILPNEVLVGSVVRLAEGKGLTDLLHAFALISSASPHRLLLVGDGPLRADLQSLAESLGIAGRVIFAGQQTDPDPFFRAMDIFVLAVPEGSMSIALLEAMARQVPSVITFGGPEEAVIDGVTGRTATPRDPEALAAVLSELVDDPVERSRLGLAGLAHVQATLSARRVACDLLSVYGTARSGEIPIQLQVNALPRGSGTVLGCRRPDQDNMAASGELLTDCVSLGDCVAKAVGDRAEDGAVNVQVHS